MSTPPDESNPPADEGVSLHKSQPPLDFDPYRFGAPDHPVPPEYAPPGYVPPPVFAPPPAAASGNVPAPPPYSQWHQYPQYPPPPTGNGKAIAALVLGIASIVFCWATVFDVVPVVLGLIFGLLGLRQSARLPRRAGHGMAMAGIACSIAGAVLAILITVWMVHVVNQYCGGFGGDSSALQHCVQQHI